MLLKKKTCIRCGVCCATGACSKGKENEEGVCIYLKRDKNRKTMCSLVTEKKVRPEEVGINGSGCVLRLYPKIYNKYKKQCREALSNVR